MIKIPMHLQKMRGKLEREISAIIPSILLTSQSTFQLNFIAISQHPLPIENIHQYGPHSRQHQTPLENKGKKN